MNCQRIVNEEKENKIYLFTLYHKTNPKPSAPSWQNSHLLLFRIVTNFKPYHSFLAFVLGRLWTSMFLEFSKRFLFKSLLPFHVRWSGNQVRFSIQVFQSSMSSLLVSLTNDFRDMMFAGTEYSSVLELFFDRIIRIENSPSVLRKRVAKKAFLPSLQKSRECQLGFLTISIKFICNISSVSLSGMPEN